MQSPGLRKHQQTGTEAGETDLGREVSSQMVLSGENLFLWFLGSQLRKDFQEKAEA